MNSLEVHFGEGSMAGLGGLGAHTLHAGDGSEIRIGVLEGGTVNGLPSVAIGFVLPGKIVAICETTARLFVGAARAIAARYPEIDERAHSIDALLAEFKKTREYEYTASPADYILNDFAEFLKVRM